MRKWLILLLLTVGVAASAQTVRVGTKKFTESYVLGQIAKKTLEDAGIKVDLKENLGATQICWQALEGGSIDTYPEYTGTIAEEILKRPGMSLTEMRSVLEPKGIGITGELGFNNTYALVMKRKKAESLGIKTMSDLANHPELKAGPTHEFLTRKDGWDPLSQKYGIHLADVKGIDHELGYTALNSGAIDLKDCYSTDAEIQKYDLVVLEDDKGFFPAYKAVFLYRLSIPSAAVQALKSLEGTINEPLMIKMNAKAGATKSNEQAAAIYFENRTHRQVTIAETGVAAKIAEYTKQHLELVAVSLLLAILVGIPLGIAASKPGLASHLILGGTGVLQTIPSLALLALVVPLLGIGFWTAIVALFLYSLLPIVRNTATGIANISPSLRESAEALGLEKGAQLRKIYLPLAMPTIMAGIKTSAVINVGTATLAAWVGAGGLGDPIIKGMAVNDTATILQGAIPAAVLAILVQLLFDGLEKAVVPRGLRLRRP